MDQRPFALGRIVLGSRFIYVTSKILIGKPFLTRRKRGRPGKREAAE
jgi:hypothetical protein